MRGMLIAIASGLLIVGVMGCTSTQTSNTAEPKMMKTSDDCCSHCAGKQTMTANGTCPACGTKVQS